MEADDSNQGSIELETVFVMSLPRLSRNSYIHFEY